MNTIDVVERRPSTIKLSSLFTETEALSELFIRTYFALGDSAYIQLKTIFESSDTQELFVKNLWNFLVEYGSNPALFDASVEISVEQIKQLTDEQRNKLWADFVAEYCVLWATNSTQRFYDFDIFVYGVELKAMSQIMDNSEIAVLNKEPYTAALVDEHGYKTFFNDNFPVKIQWTFVNYLILKWKESKRVFEKDPDNVAFAAFIEKLCDMAFVNTQQKNTNLKFMYMLIAASKEVRETVKRNYEAGLSVLPAEETVESIQTNPRTVENMDIDYFVGLLNAEWGVTEKQAEERGTYWTRWFSYEIGKRYCRITTGSYQQAGKGSAYCFIDLENGNIYKPAGYKAPDKKHVRGNIFAKNPLDGLNEHGVNYLR